MTLRFLLLKQGYELPFPCGGEGICGKCRVLFSHNPPQPSIYDKRILQEQEISKGVRLACKAVINGDCTVVLPSLETGVSLVSTGDLLMPLGDLVEEPPSQGKAYCVGIDLGTTTIFISLAEISRSKRLGWKKVANPQAAWGSDLMSRVKAASDPETTLQMRQVTMNAIEEVVKGLLSSNDLSPEQVAYALAGNAPMEELFFSETLGHFGKHPFSGKLSGSQIVDGPFAQPMALLPVAGGMIGGDALSLLEVARIKRLSLPMLGMDLGTNAEIFVVTERGIFATSAPAGPAFEGMGMKHGVGWRRGAVSLVEKEGNSLKVETVGDASPEGFCGSGILSFLALLVTEWVVGRDGRIRDPGGLPSLWDGAVREEDGERVVYLPGTSLSISQQEIRQIQMATAAVSSAIKILLRRSGCSISDVATVAVSGGFGSSLKPRWLKALGIPLPPFAQVVILGNTALCGAELWNASGPAPEQLSRMARETQVVQLAEEEGFQEIYIDSMVFGE